LFGLPRVSQPVSSAKLDWPNIPDPLSCLCFTDPY
jgi:hypothetical protein